MKAVQYFRHDYDARHDEKLTKVRRVYGAEGLGIYWCIVECLYNGGGKLPLSEIEDIAYDLHFEAKTIEKIIKTFGLFQWDDKYFWSNTVLSRLKERKDISKKRREAALSMHRKKEGSDANAEQVQSKIEANAEQYKKEKEKEEIKNEKDNNSESKDSLSVDTDSEENVTYNDIVTFYNETVRGKNITQCVKLTEKRKAAIRARLKEYGADKVYEAIRRCSQSSFCNGHNERNWKADFDFVFNANKMARILEGKYDDNNLDRKDSGRVSRQAGEEALRSIFTEMEERRRTEGVVD